MFFGTQRALRWLIAAAVFPLLISCRGDDAHEEPPKSFEGFSAPAHFPAPVYGFENNPVTEAGFELGKKLFYDKRLSADGTVSCGTCHAQVHGFADHNIPLSFGIEGRRGMRNTPGLANLAWTPAFMWDGGINHIEVIPIAPLTDSTEMGHDLAALISFLQTQTEYPEDFEKAFGSSEIDTRNLLLALTQFQSCLISAGSKYDQWLTGRTNLTTAENEGREIFESKCASCHSGVLLTDFSYRNNGLDSIFTDEGRMRITLNPEDAGTFRVPSLRNVALTSPYMHDGRFRNLMQVLDHYDSGVKQSATLDPSLSGGIPLEDHEKERLIDFLRTLSDYDFISNHRFSEP